MKPTYSSAKSTYGDRLLPELSRALTAEFGKGFSYANLRNFRQFYLTYPDPEICYALRSKLSWTHHRLIMRVKSHSAREYYITHSERENWSTRTLERQIETRSIEHLCPTFAPGGLVLYIGDTENKFVHLETSGLAALGVTLDSAAKIPDVIVHDTKRNWLLLIEAVTSAGPVDGKRRKELKDLFTGCKAGLVFVTAFEDRRTMQKFISHIAWESEVSIAEDPDHMIHFNGERFLGPYPDVMPKKP